MGYEVKLSLQESKLSYKPSKLGHNVVVFYQSSSVSLCMQDYKSLCVVIMICATQVNTRTHRQTAFWLVKLSAQLASWAENAQQFNSLSASANYK